MQNQVADSDETFEFHGRGLVPVLAGMSCVTWDLSLNLLEPLFSHITYTRISACGKASGRPSESSPPSFLRPGALLVLAAPHRTGRAGALPVFKCLS